MGKPRPIRQGDRLGLVAAGERLFRQLGTVQDLVEDGDGVPVCVVVELSAPVGGRRWLVSTLEADPPERLEAPL